MGDFLLAVVAVIAVAYGAFYLGRAGQQDRISHLLDEVEDLNHLVDDLLGMRQPSPTHPALRVLRGDE